jgi:hypothetical protein
MDVSRTAGVDDGAAAANNPAPYVARSGLMVGEDGSI